MVFPFGKISVLWEGIAFSMCDFGFIFGKKHSRYTSLIRFWDLKNTKIREKLENRLNNRALQLTKRRNKMRRWF